MENAQGECYDAASGMLMAGAKSGVTSRIKALNRKCLYTHGYGHALNLFIKDACNKLSYLKNTIVVSREICRIVKLSRSPLKGKANRKY